MHFLLLGASGRTGQLVLSQALAQNHTVTALVRNPSSFPTTNNDNVTLVQGTPTNASDLSTALSGSKSIDAVIITLAVTRKTDSPFSALASPPFLIRDTLRALLPQMCAHGVRKLVVMSAFGTGASWRNLAWPMKLVMKYTNMSYVIDDHDAVERELKGDAGDGVEWAIVKAARLVEGEGEGKVVREFGEDGQGVGLLGTVTREGVAGVLVKAAEGGEEWNERVVVVTN